MKFTLTIDMDNAAFQEPYSRELERIVIGVAAQLQAAHLGQPWWCECPACCNSYVHEGDRTGHPVCRCPSNRNVPRCQGLGYRVRDINGNTVGRWEVQP